jgi:hypothetical protein
MQLGLSIPNDPTPKESAGDGRIRPCDRFSGIGQNLANSGQGSACRQDTEATSRLASLS